MISPPKVVESKEEKEAKDLLSRGHVDQAITAYQHVKPETAPALFSLGTIFFEKKGDYLTAKNYYEKALQMQEKVTFLNKLYGRYWLIFRQVKMTAVH